jgi:protein SCO1/2
MLTTLAILLSTWLVGTQHSAPASTSSASPLADIGPAPEVRLTDQDGKPFSLSDLRGKVVVVSFIYTTCGGSCPATTHRLSRIEEVLQSTKLWGKKVEFVSISLDPERDTPEILRRYAETYDADPAAWHFLTGPPERVAKVIASWDMWVRKNPAGVLDHPSRVFLLDTRGHRREIYSLEFLTAEVVRRDIEGLLAEAEAP